ncbi:MAG: CvpA family protein [Candidatus Omnitrophica bacterium]|nr:CvpA family protein [Candidatus Omnitrophota bacterium]MCM8802139.1 CvpA family protein [Candidatus Omnitrophota bacterium]
MTGIDFIILIIFCSGILTGILRGFIGGIIDIIGIFGGVSLASIAYKAPVNLFRRFNIIGTPVDVLFFHLFSFLFILSIIVGIEVLRRKVYIKHVVDRIFGFFTGIIEGLFFSAFLLNIMSASPNAAKEIDQAKFTKYITRFVPQIYLKSDKIGITLPKLIALPKNYQDEFNREKLTISFQKTNFYKMKGTCIKCGGEVGFSGYFLKAGTSVIPKFTCKICGRTSDGCQTFEIFHFLYNQCPAELSRKEIKFDCGNFPNRELVMPKTQCPIDKNQLQIWEWQPPIKY